MDASAWNERYAASDLVWSATPNTFVARHLADLTPARAVDLGAGEGRNALWLAQSGWQVTAVDFAEVGLEKGRAIAERIKVEVDWVCADVLAWQPPEAVQLTVVAYLQFPMPEREQLVANAAAMTAVGGTLCWISHDSHNLEHGVGGPQDPAVLTDVGALRELLERHGRWAVTEAGRVERQVDVDGSRATAYDTLLVARREG